MSSSIPDTKEQHTINHAKNLSQSFLNIYKDVISDSNAKRSQAQNYSEIFDSALLYFSYLDSCKQFLNYLIKLENQLYRDNQTIKCTDEAAEALKNSKTIKWIHEEVSLMNNGGHVSSESLISRLQDENSHIIEPKKTQLITDFTSSDVKKRYSLSKLVNIQIFLTSPNKKNINVFIGLLDNLFERVLPIQCFKFPVLILKQFNPRIIDKDFFSIIRELIDIYRVENSIESNSNKNELLFKEVAENIVNCKKNLDKKLISNFENTEKHCVIEVLTTFSIVEDESYEMSDNLTQLNQSAILSFSEHEPLNDYLQYLDKLWLQKISRKNSKPILKINLEKIVNEQVRYFLNLNFDECLKRIYLYFIKKDSLDPQLTTIEKELLARIDIISIENLKDELISEVKQVCFSFDNKNYMPLESAFTFANSWSSFNENKSAENELFTRAILRLIINLDKAESPNINNRIAEAVKEELCCLYRELFNHYLLGESLGDDFKKGIELKYDEYLQDIFSVFKIWLIFLISQKVFLQQKESFDNFVFNYFTMFINHRKKPSSTDAFIYGKDKNKNSDYERIEITENRDTQVPKIKTDESINKSLIEYIDTKTIKFDVTDKAKDVLKANGVNLWSFISLTSTEQLSKLWESEIGFDTKELIAFSLIQDFLRSAEKILKQEDKEIPQYLESRDKFQKYIKNQWRNNFFIKIQNQTFPKIIFNFNKSFEDKLKDKIEVLSNLHSINDERYLIEAQLGKGAFGVVYKAKDLMFNTTVAIKLIPHWFKSEEVSKRLIQEASIMRNSQHENVVTVYDLVKLPAHKLIPNTNCRVNHLDIFDENEDTFALIMEEVYGGVTLEDFVNSIKYTKEGFVKPHERKIRTYEQRIKILQKICSALEGVHLQEVIHGDIKPENILVDKNGVPKLTDFGISTLKGGDSIGATSLLFASPNVINNEECTIQDDIYSLGILSVYIMCPRIKTLFQGIKRDEANKIKEDLYIGLVQMFIILYTWGHFSKTKNFKLDFLEDKYTILETMKFYTSYTTSSILPDKAIISSIYSDLKGKLITDNKILTFLHLVLKAISPSMGKYSIFDIGEVPSEYKNNKPEYIIFDSIKSVNYFSFLLSQCLRSETIGASSELLLWGERVSKKEIDYLLDSSSFTKLYRKHFYDPNLPKIKILWKDSRPNTDLKDYILWEDEYKGIVASLLNRKSFSKEVEKLKDFTDLFEDTQLPVISYLKEIKNKADFTIPTRNIFEKMMLMHMDRKYKEIDVKQEPLPEDLKNLLNELWIIMESSKDNISLISPLSVRKKAMVYIERIKFKGIETSAPIDLSAPINSENYSYPVMVESAIESAIKSNEGSEKVTLVNCFYDFLIHPTSSDTLRMVEDVIQKISLNDSFEELLKFVDSFYEGLKNHWEYQLLNEYLAK